MTMRLYCVVEGHGDVTALPKLVRRICGEVLGVWDLAIETPYRLPKGKFANDLELRKAVTLGLARLKERAEDGDKLLLIVSRDADDECPKDLKEELSSRISPWDAGQHCQVVIPNEEFEAWILAGSAGLLGHHDCVDEIPTFEDVEEIGSPKSVFERKVLRPGRAYSETIDQEKFVSQISLGEETFLKSRSMRRLKDVLSRALA